MPATAAAVYAGTIISAAILGAVGTPAASAAWRYIEQNWTILAVARNKAREDELAMFQNGLETDPAFQQLVFQWQKALEKPYCCCCCRSGAKIAARRLRVALRRVVDHKRKLPPIGPPLLADDDAPLEAHTPVYRREVQEQMHLLEDRTFGSSQLAITLAENILLAAQEDLEDAMRTAAEAPYGLAAPAVRPAATHTERASVAGAETASASRGRAIATQGGDIGPGGPDRSTSNESRASIRASVERVSGGWLSSAVDASRIGRASATGPSPLGTPGRVSLEGGSVTSAAPVGAGPAAGPSHGAIASKVPSEVDTLPDTPENRPVTSSPADVSLRATFGGGEYQSVHPFDVEGPAQAPGTSYAPHRGVRGAFGSLQSLLGFGGGPPAPASGPAVGTTPPASGPAVGPTPPASGPAVGPTPPASKHPARPGPGSAAAAATRRSEQQYFGQTPRDRRRLIDAAKHNLGRNEIDSPVSATRVAATSGMRPPGPPRPPPPGGGGPRLPPSSSGPGATTSTPEPISALFPDPSYMERRASADRAWDRAAATGSRTAPPAPAPGAGGLGRGSSLAVTGPPAAGDSVRTRGPAVTAVPRPETSGGGREGGKGSSSGRTDPSRSGTASGPSRDAGRDPPPARTRLPTAGHPGTGPASVPPLAIPSLYLGGSANPDPGHVSSASDGGGDGGTAGGSRADSRTARGRGTLFGDRRGTVASRKRETEEAIRSGGFAAVVSPLNPASAARSPPEREAGSPMRKKYEAPPPPPPPPPPRTRPATTMPSTTLASAPTVTLPMPPSGRSSRTDPMMMPPSTQRFE